MKAKTNIIDEQKRLQVRQYLASQGDIASWMLDEHQLELYTQIKDLDKEEYSLICSRRWGKSFLTLTIASEFCICHPKTNVLIMAPTLKAGYDIVDGILRPHFMEPLAHVMSQTKSRLEWTFTNGSKLTIGTCERANIDASCRGKQSPDLVIWEEDAAAVKSMDLEYAYKSVVSPAVMRTSAKQIHCTTLSSEPDHFLHEFIIPKCKEIGTYYERDIYTNTALTQVQIDKAIRDAGGLTNEHCLRELMCKLVKSNSHAVFPNYLNKQNTVELPAYYNSLIVADMGGIRDKTVFLLCVYDWYNKKKYIIDEKIFEANTSTTDMLKVLVPWENDMVVKPKYRYLDAHGQTRVDLEKAGYHTLMPCKTDVLNSINQARIGLENEDLLIDTIKCPFTHQSCYNAQFAANLKDFDRHSVYGHYDAIAALVYANRMLETLKNIGFRLHPFRPVPSFLHPIFQPSSQSAEQYGLNICG